jgi:hypothetical protein
LPATSIVSADADIDDETLVAEHDATSRIGQGIFGAGGLEDVGEDEDGDVDNEVSTRHADIDPFLLYDRFIPARTKSGGRIPELRYASEL